MTAALKARLASGWLTPVTLTYLPLAPIRSSYPWVSAFGFPQGVLALAAADADLKKALTQDLGAMKDATADAVEQSNIMDLIAAVNAQ